MADEHSVDHDYLMEDETYRGRFNARLWLRIYRHVLPYRAHVAGLAGLAGRKAEGSPVSNARRSCKICSSSILSPGHAGGRS